MTVGRVRTRAGDRARVFGREPTTFEECGLPASMVKHLTENVGLRAGGGAGENHSSNVSRSRRLGARGDRVGKDAELHRAVVQ